MIRPPALRGRGSSSNPGNRFESIARVPDPIGADEVCSPATQFLADRSRSVIAYNESPDVGFAASVNPYRGCEHGCVYCYARPTHEFLGFSAGLDFETKIVVKSGAPEILRRELSRPQWRPRVLAMSGVTDCYQPVERRLRLTRRCLEVLCEFRNPVAIVTKNFLVTRDLDILGEMARYDCAAVFVSLTTLDDKLSGSMEPRASRPERRLAAIRLLAQARVPVGFLLAPMIPGLNDIEAAKVASAAAAAGATFGGYVALRLPYAVKSIFAEWLERHYPEKKKKILNRIRSIRGGSLNDPRFGSRMRGEGIFARQMGELFRLACAKAGLDGRRPMLSTAHFRRGGGSQLELL
jgi:DNA repair photolyase